MAVTGTIGYWEMYNNGNFWDEEDEECIYSYIDFATSTICTTLQLEEARSDTKQPDTERTIGVLIKHRYI